MTNTTAVGRCCMEASVNASISFRSPSGLDNTPGVSMIYNMVAHGRGEGGFMHCRSYWLYTIGHLSLQGHLNMGGVVEF